MPKEDYVIQVWTSGYDFWITDLLRKGYRMIFSNSDAWYLDCGFGAWIYSGQGSDNNWCSPFKSWKILYSNSPRELIVNQGLPWNQQIKNLVWGGEAAMWSEQVRPIVIIAYINVELISQMNRAQVDEQAVESRVWPRLSAMAERLWSDPTTPWQEAESRFLQHRHRLVQRGIRADAVVPEFCRMHDGWCFMPPKKYGQFAFFDGANSGNNEWVQHPINGEDSAVNFKRNSGNFANISLAIFYKNHCCFSLFSEYSIHKIIALLVILLVALGFLLRRRLCPLMLGLIQAVKHSSAPHNRKR